MTIKSWFLMKNFDANERIAISMTEPTVERETEKAMLLKWNTEFGIIKSWIPKSCIEAEPVITEEIKESINQYARDYAEKEAAFVKGAKVKNINGRKVFTIMSGISYGTVLLDNGKRVNIDKLVLA